MHKIIAIGESVLDTIYDADNRPVRAFVVGLIANAAAILAKSGEEVSMVSECCTDHVGDIIVKFLADNGVNTKSVDRYTDGATAISMIFENGHEVRRINYDSYPNDRFDVVWPRIDENDVLLFGSFYSIDNNVRNRLFEMVTYAAERKAIIVYLPGCQHGINCRITKVMPAILENLEIADVVIATGDDIEAIFPGEDADKTFKNHIEFYGPLFLYIGKDYSVTAYSRGNKLTVKAKRAYSGDSLGWQSRFTACIIKEMSRRGITKKSRPSGSQEQWHDIIGTAIDAACNA